MENDPPGVCTGRRPGRPWVTVARGLHRLPETGALDLHAWQLALPPSGRFTHLTGAGIHGLWLPPLPDSLPVFASMAVTEPRPRRAGLRIARMRTLAETATVDGLVVDPVPESLLACARDLDVLDLVVLLDSALQLRKCTLEELTTHAESSRRGSSRLRHALRLVDGRSESPYETLLRVLHVVCDIEVEPQYELKDEHGAFVAEADLWLKGTHSLHEYDGAVHLPRAQQRKDLARARRIGNVTWVRRGYTSHEVLHQGVAILRDADLALGRRHDPARIRAWHQLLAASLFTPSGRRRLESRLGIGGARCGQLGAVRGSSSAPK
jgi:hypothetical protein